MAYLGNTPTTQNFVSGTDYFNGTGSQTAFTLTRTVGSVNDVEAVINNVVQQPNSAYTISGNTITFTSAPSAGTSNIYVRYLSTTTQVITPSQNTVGLTQLTADMQNGIGQAFKNRIINGAMMIDQRYAGASVTNPAGTTTYITDRWAIYGSAASKFTAQQNAGSVTPPAGFTNYLGITSLSAYTVGASEVNNILQYIEGLNVADLGWGTANAQSVTLSFWVRSSLTGTFGGSLQNSAQNRSYPFTYTISAANTWEQKSITVAGDTTGTWLTTNGKGIGLAFGLGIGSTFSGTAGAWAGATYFGATGATSVVGTSGATLYITGVQLEKGSTATSFDYRPYGTELNLCYRYFQKFLGSSAYEALPSYAIAGSGTSVEGFLAYKGTMRSTPTLSISTLCLLDAVNVLSISGASAINNGVDSMRITYSGISGLTQYRSYYVTANNSTSAFLTLSAEL